VGSSVHRLEVHTCYTTHMVHSGIVWSCTLELTSTSAIPGLEKSLHRLEAHNAIHRVHDGLACGVQWGFLHQGANLLGAEFLLGISLVRTLEVSVHRLEYTGAHPSTQRIGAHVQKSMSSIDAAMGLRLDGWISGWLGGAQSFL
jgi:hypothetical protein